MLAAHSKGLICISAPRLRSDLNRRRSSRTRRDDADRLAHTYRDMFGRDNFFLEIQDHGLDQDKRLTPEVNRLSVDTGIPLVVTNDSTLAFEERTALPPARSSCTSSADKTIIGLNRMRCGSSGCSASNARSRDGGALPARLEDACQPPLGSRREVLRREAG